MAVARTLSFAELNLTGSLGTVTFRESGWFLVRAIADVSNTFRFASTGPFCVEVGPVPRRVSRVSAQFFLDWVRERQQQIKTDALVSEIDQVTAYQKEAEQFWEQKVTKANVD